MQGELPGGAADGIWAIRVEFKIGVICVDMDEDFRGYMRVYAYFPMRICVIMDVPYRICGRYG
jgi:hypothetical protein